MLSNAGEVLFVSSHLKIPLQRFLMIYFLVIRVVFSARASRLYKAAVLPADTG